MTEPTPKRKPIWLFGAFLLVPALLAGALYLDSLPKEPYLPPASMKPPKPAAPTIALARVQALESRISAVERTQAEILEKLATQSAAPTAPLTNDGAVDSTPLFQEIERLQADVEALKSAPSVPETMTEATPPPPIQDTLLVKLYKLEKLIHTGQPFDDALETLLEDPALPAAAHLKLHGLLKTAKRGIVSVRQLETLFDESMDAYMSGGTLALPENASTWEQIKENLGSLITIRKLGDAEGEGNEARLARAAEAFAEEDITAAVEEVAQLDDEVKGYFNSWLNKARRHLRVMRAIERARDLLEESSTSTPMPVSPDNV